MPSAAHQTLLLWAARKMMRDGFRLGGYDGRSIQGGAWNGLDAPPTVAGVRPDAWGYDGARLALAEAKTARDVDTEHTRTQLRAFLRLGNRTATPPWRLYFAIPRSAAPSLDRVMAELGLVSSADIVRLHVPDILLEGAA
jgi:hypothetical protein